MKKMPFVVIIPALAVALVVGGAMIWKMNTPTVDPVAATPPPQLPRSIEQAHGGKPTNSFSFFFGSQVTPTATPTPETLDSMYVNINAVGDDGGAADINSLKADAGGL